jgi:kinetochore protein Nuf2
MVADTIQRSRSRIVQSPERIKRTISTMSSTVLEEKRTVTIHDAKARDLQTKINGILSVEKVRTTISNFFLCV